ncbi:MAG: aldehyde dehydrogenase family protein, partial [Fuerstiella sp.]|nr:aldehyde dehydrogenase family protein [Fuerstiella sp.]
MLLKNFVDGKYIDNASGETFAVINPATGAEIYQVQVADSGVINAAVESSQKGFKLWSGTPAID